MLSTVLYLLFAVWQFAVLHNRFSISCRLSPWKSRQGCVRVRIFINEFPSTQVTPRVLVATNSRRGSRSYQRHSPRTGSYSKGVGRQLSALTKKEIEVREDTICAMYKEAPRPTRVRHFLIAHRQRRSGPETGWLARRIQTSYRRSFYSSWFSRGFRPNIPIVSRFWIDWYIFIMPDYCASAKIISLRDKKKHET